MSIPSDRHAVPADDSVQRNSRADVMFFHGDIPLRHQSVALCQETYANHPQGLTLTKADPATSCSITSDPYTFTFVFSLPDHISPSMFTKFLPA